VDTARRLCGYSFDAAGADFTHEDSRCTFEVLVDRYQLGGDPALVELAQIVHAADIAADVQAHPFGAALQAIGEAGVDVEADDQRLLERGVFVCETLYAWCQRQSAAGGR
jgi:hypothetical protein